MPEKRGTDDDWRELGEHLYRSRKGMADAWVKSSRMFGNVDPSTREAKELYEALGEFMVKLDARYSHEDREWTFGDPDPIFGAEKRVAHEEEKGRVEIKPIGALLSEVEPEVPNPEAEDALPEARLTWSVLVEHEPRLKHLERTVRKVKDEGGESFCANEWWYERGLKDQLVLLAGWSARNPRLRSEAAYDLAYDRLYDLLPDCRDCSCG